MTYERRKIPMSYESRDVAGAASGVLLAGALLGAALLRDAPARVSVRLTEWKVELSQGTIAPGTVRFAITNAGSIPHAFEVGGQGLEKQTLLRQRGQGATILQAVAQVRGEGVTPLGPNRERTSNTLPRARRLGLPLVRRLIPGPSSRVTHGSAPARAFS